MGLVLRCTSLGQSPCIAFVKQIKRLRQFDHVGQDLVVVEISKCPKHSEVLFKIVQVHGGLDLDEPIVIVLMITVQLFYLQSHGSLKSCLQ